MEELIYKGYTIFGNTITSISDINGYLSGVYVGIDTAKYLIDQTEGRDVDMFILTEQLQQYANANTEEKTITIDIINTILNG